MNCAVTTRVAHGHAVQPRLSAAASNKAGVSLPKLPTAGVTLMEMMLVVTIIGLIAAISFPAVTAGIDSMRLSNGSDAIVAFLNRGVNRAERRQVGVEISILRADNAVELHAVDHSLDARFTFPEGVRIEKILPENPTLEDERQRSYVIFPGGTVPRFGLQLINRKGARKIVRVDPITGVPQVENL